MSKQEGATAPASHDIGVLFVHGIGDQIRGATLDEFGLPLIESTGDWLGSTNVERSQVSEPVDGAPSHAYVTVREDGRTLRVLTAESWWAPVFHTPRYPALMRWLLSAVPFVVQRVVDGGLRRSTSRMKRRSEGVRRSGPAGRVGQLVLLVALSSWRLVQNVLALAVTIVVMLGLIAVGLLTFTSRARERIFTPAQAAQQAPLNLIRRLVTNRLPRWLRDILIGSIGDSYALLRDKKAGDLMVDQVQRDLAWLEERDTGARVVIIAHSQGAELARRVLKRRTTGRPVDSLITFGAGIEKLDAVDRLRKRLRLAWTAFALRIVSGAGLLLSLAAVAGSAPLLGSVVWWTPAIALPIAFASLAAARRVLVLVVGEYDEQRLGVTNAQVARWLDLYASHDPVSEGPLPLSGLGVSNQIVNRRSTLLDHTAYWQNVEAFRAAVALELARVAGWPGMTTRPPACIVAAAADRAKRVWWLVGSHATIAVAALGVGALVARDVGEAVAHAIGAIDGGVETFLLGGWWSAALGCLVLAGVAAGLALLASLVWDRWSHERTVRLLAERCGQSSPL